VLCVIPTSFPVNLQNLNWTIVIVGVVLLLVLAAWFFPVLGARTWYRGKAHTLPNANIVRCPPPAAQALACTCTRPCNAACSVVCIDLQWVMP
jgi:hypothetical protein